MAKSKGPNLDTPAMRQYRRFKDQHPGCVLFFRMGDFYEMFLEDAVLAHETLGVTLTQRTEGVPMAGVPFHSVEPYLKRMIEAGHRVAVCEQVEDAAQAKGVVKRDVTRVLTPGTLTDETLLDAGADNPLAAVAFLGPGDAPDGPAALAWCEVSAGEFRAAAFDHLSDLAAELARIGPTELLVAETATGEAPPRALELAGSLGVSITPRPAGVFTQTAAHQALCRQFSVAHLGGFGFDDHDPALGPAGAVLDYLRQTQRTPTGQPTPNLRSILPFNREDHLVIDPATLASLEVVRTLRTGEQGQALVGALQGARTPMGKRLLRRWLAYPSRDLSVIRSRHDAVQAMVDDDLFARDLREALSPVQDVPRIVSRLGVGRATPRDLVALAHSASAIAPLLEALAERPSVAPYYARLEDVAAPLLALAEHLHHACVEEPPAHLRNGGLIRDGHDAELDRLRHLGRDADAWLAQYQADLSQQHNIPNVKVGFNKVFGYYIELSAAQRSKAPPEWKRKQTLKNAERYITPELKAFEDKALTAESQALAREQELFAQLCERAAKHAGPLSDYADATAELDVLRGFADLARKRGYCRPEMVEHPALRLTGARHPVLDQTLADRFVPNDVALRGRLRSPDSQNNKNLNTAESTPSLALITGPNMAGKSTYIRTAALCVLLAHAGCFVPADEAVVGLTDRIFTRVGSADELHTGRSTFMVEMTETAAICHHATPHSLVVLDEIGRGTSTLDGLSLAWAVAEHLAERGPRALFATHYHELTRLDQTRPTVANLHVTAREWDGRVVFLHKVEPGGADRSYGIQVAKLAGLPDSVVARATDLLGELSVQQRGAPAPGSSPGTGAGNGPPESTEGPDATPREPVPHMPLFAQAPEHPVVDTLRTTVIETLSPLGAFDLLRKLKQELADGADAAD
ncbi:MAG: DNA mismatch repair protein MutS [Planctomycetota bacterium]